MYSTVPLRWIQFGGGAVVYICMESRTTCSSDTSIDPSQYFHVKIEVSLIPLIKNRSLSIYV